MNESSVTFAHASTIMFYNLNFRDRFDHYYTDTWLVVLLWLTAFWILYWNCNLLILLIASQVTLKFYLAYKLYFTSARSFLNLKRGAIPTRLTSHINQILCRCVSFALRKIGQIRRFFNRSTIQIKECDTLLVICVKGHLKTSTLLCRKRSHITPGFHYFGQQQFIQKRIIFKLIFSLQSCRCELWNRTFHRQHFDHHLSKICNSYTTKTFY